MKITEYWQEIAKTSGLPEDQVKLVEQVLQNEKVSNAFVPRPEYSRSLNEQTEKYNELVKKNADYYQTEAQRAAENQKKVEEALKTAQRYRDLYGEIEEGKPIVSSPAFDASKYVPIEEFQKKVNEIGAQSLFVTKEGIKAASDYMFRFKEPLDVDALEKYAIEHKLPINMAYKEFIQPKLEAQQNASFEEKLKRAREEGAQEALSRVKLPIDNAPKESTPLLQNLAAQRDKSSVKSEGDRLASFAEAYAKGNNAT